MIFTRWGTEVEIIGYCGKHKPKWASGQLVLVRTRAKDDGRGRYEFAQSLRADAGWVEIDNAVDAAPEIKLSDVELTKAMQVAE